MIWGISRTAARVVMFCAVFLGFGQGVDAETLVARGGVLRVLDRMNGVVSDYDLTPGQQQVEGRLTFRLDECRYPSDLPLGDAYAHVTIMDSGLTDPVFKGWMVASSPGLSALDHPRYDVWVLHCDVPDAALAPVPDSTNSTAGSGG